MYYYSYAMAVKWIKWKVQHWRIKPNICNGHLYLETWNWNIFILEVQIFDIFVLIDFCLKLYLFDDERFFRQSTSAGLFILLSLQAVKQCTTSISRQPDMPLNLQDFSQIAVNNPPTIENSPKFSCINKLNNIKF